MYFIALDSRLKNPVYFAGVSPAGYMNWTRYAMQAFAFTSVTAGRNYFKCIGVEAGDFEFIWYVPPEMTEHAIKSEAKTELAQIRSKANAGTLSRAVFKLCRAIERWPLLAVAGLAAAIFLLVRAGVVLL